MKKQEYMGWRSARRDVRPCCPRTTHNRERREAGRSDRIEGCCRRGSRKKIWLYNLNEWKFFPIDDLLSTAVN
ncbi:hypothetical protein DPMN_144317 [Dreissena polymorpha]|uniref:Uncharacterized protein n=1 Tax=Dreissena polymorpha TaxID=45954 RepID=A0A9D4GHW7_DREPO|nr:hypothetical protein DPMN_144317 [Dreissena polymorpha]